MDAEEKLEVEKKVFSVNQFCAAHGISRALFYILLKDGSGPRVMRVRGRTLISNDAARDWLCQMEKAA